MKTELLCRVCLRVEPSSEGPRIFCEKCGLKYQKAEINPFEIRLSRLISLYYSDRDFTLESGFSEDATKQSKIPFAPINDTLTDPNIFGAEDPTTSEDTYVGATVQGSTSSTQSSGTGQNAVERKRTSTYKTGARIHDCIAAIVRDSSYVRELISPEKIGRAHV